MKAILLGSRWRRVVFGMWTNRAERRLKTGVLTKTRLSAKEERNGVFNDFDNVIVTPHKFERRSSGKTKRRRGAATPERASGAERLKILHSNKPED